MNTTHGRPEQGAGRGGGHAVLAGAGLGDDARLAEAPGQERLAERVVDLVGARVGEVLALEVQAEVRGIRVRAPASPTPPPERRVASPRRATASARRSARYSAVGRPANRPSSSSQLRPEPRVVPDRVVGGPRAARGRRSASRARTVRRNRAPSPIDPVRRPRAGPAWTGVGRTATFGRSIAGMRGHA